MARGGVEPPTFRFSVGRSYQLSYLAGARSTVAVAGGGNHTGGAEPGWNRGADAVWWALGDAPMLVRRSADIPRKGGCTRARAPIV